MRISDWSSDVCSSDLNLVDCIDRQHRQPEKGARVKDLQGFGKASLVESVRFAQMEKFIPVDGPIEHEFEQIGRASCRERVCQRVDLGGRRIIKKKNSTLHGEYRSITANIHIEL